MKQKKNRNKGALEGKEDLSDKDRIPRPLGITLQLKQLRNKGESLDEVKRIVIEQWVSAGMMLNEKIYTLEQISSYVNMEPSIVMKYMWKAMGKMGRFMDTKDASEIARVIFSQSLKKSLEISALTAQQAAILMRAQGDKYVPFLTAAVNQALGNLNATQAPFLALLKTLTDKQEFNIILNNNNATTTNQYITSNEALKLLNNGTPSMLEAPKLADQEYTQLALPDVNPNTQNIAEITKPKYLNPEPNPIAHEDRRQLKERVIDEVLDEEDFTM